MNVNFVVTLDHDVQGGFDVAMGLRRRWDRRWQRLRVEYDDPAQGTGGPSHTVSVTIKGDTMAKADETFTVNLGGRSRHDRHANRGHHQRRCGQRHDQQRRQRPSEGRPLTPPVASKGIAFSNFTIFRFQRRRPGRHSRVHRRGSALGDGNTMSDQRAKCIRTDRGPRRRRVRRAVVLHVQSSSRQRVL